MNELTAARQKQAQLLNELAKKGMDPDDPEVRQRYEEFKVDVTKKAVQILKEHIPAKILFFNELVTASCASGDFLHSRDLEPTVLGPHEEPASEEESRPAKRMKSAAPSPVQCDGVGALLTSFPLHAQNIEMKKRVLCYALELIEMVGAIKLWIQLNVPRIEDGNNFGVAIQEETIQELSHVKDSAFSLCDGVKYHTTRARLISKVMKYPHVADYTQSVVEVDKKEWLHTKIALIGIRDGYSMLYDLLHKNWEKVVKPRSGDSCMAL